jgi:hypothetical protein
MGGTCNLCVMTPNAEMLVMEVLHKQDEKNQEDQKSRNFIKEIKNLIYHFFN